MKTRVNARPITSHRDQARLSLRVQSDPANLAAVRKAVEALAAENGFDADAVSQVGLCVNEAMANIIRHAYEGRTDRPMHLKAWIEPKGNIFPVRKAIREGGVMLWNLRPSQYFSPDAKTTFGKLAIHGILTTMKRRKSRA